MRGLDFLLGKRKFDMIYVYLVFRFFLCRSRPQRSRNYTPEQECTVLGSRKGPECAVFNRSGAQADHVPQRCVLQVQNPESQLFVTEYIADTNVHLHSVPEPKQGKERVPRQHMSL